MFFLRMSFKADLEKGQESNRRISQSILPNLMWVDDGEEKFKTEVKKRI